MLAYLSEVRHREAFIKIYEKLRLTEKPKFEPARRNTTELERDVEQLKRLLHGILALGGKDLVEKAKKTSGLEDVKIRNLLVKAKTRSEVTKAISRIGEDELKKRQEEYKKLIEENNNNH
jgi:hypothetical protein